ncbi:polynucleotide kinase-phosphatase [Paenibacillus bovis]|uniref:Polynucleotide kinase-phosphatase n=1 Tax=Paenibacillus bovis TaxID=1616788 RepID=A0A172ZE84_9BACL|nr:polynucleotide kinase-phosphatase [Paenibacillus bovis]ANF95839.1 polynucleotide kinase-phosphatase [Paenibacillus bovis]
MNQQSPNKHIQLPHAGIILLMGASNSGKSTWIRSLMEQGVIGPNEAVSSDQFRAVVGDTEHIDWRRSSRDESEVLYQQYRLISDKAFRVMEEIIRSRCRLNLTTWVDATHLHPEDRAVYIEIGRRYHVPVTIIALDIPEKTLLERDREREHARGRQRVKQHYQVFRKNIFTLKSEGFRAVHILKPQDMASVTFERKANPLIHDLDHGIDIIGDIHGCYEEMIELIQQLGYEPDKDEVYRHPDGRQLVSVGDIMSRGPRSMDTMLFWQRQIAAGQGLMVDSNHGWKVARYLEGRKVTMNHGDEKFAAELEAYGAEHGAEAMKLLQNSLKDMLMSAPSHLVFQRNGIRCLVVAHAGIQDRFIGKQSRRIDDYCRYGDVSETGEDGRPVRKDWFTDHTSGEIIVWGHDPRPQPTVVNRTINIDQGAVFGGRLTAYRYPEQRFVSVEAKEDYAQDPDSPLIRWQKRRFAAPNLRQFIDGYTVLTDSYGEIGVRSEFVKSALDSTSHYTIPLEELVYIPPTMTPPPVPAEAEGYLEHPAEAVAYYRSRNVTRLVAEKKHMGSRAIVLLFRDEHAAVPYVGRPLAGTIYTRTGRAFFQTELEQMVIGQLRDDLVRAGYFDRYATDWVLLDTEIVPWNLKARELIASQYAHVSEAADMDRSYILKRLHTARAEGREVDDWITECTARQTNADIFRETFQKYCWDTEGTEGLRIAPFHILAHSSGSLMDRSHEWHMQHAAELAAYSSLFMPTEYRVMDIDNDPDSEQELIRWWIEMTEDGHEGIVLKPEYMTMYDGDRLIQPAIKVRGRKYLHMIYGMDYLQPEHLTRLKQRKTRKKERHALMEFALSLESVDRFVRREPLERMHECVLAALSLESDAIDPRL